MLLPSDHLKRLLSHDVYRGIHSKPIQTSFLRHAVPKYVKNKPQISVSVPCQSYTGLTLRPISLFEEMWGIDLFNAPKEAFNGVPLKHSVMALLHEILTIENKIFWPYEVLELANILCWSLKPHLEQKDREPNPGLQETLFYYRLTVPRDKFFGDFKAR